MAKIEMKGYLCERCQHTWVPRKYVLEEPKICPKCKSRFWNMIKNMKLALFKEIE